MSEVKKTPLFRLSYPALFEPRAYEQNEPKYSLVMLFDKKADLSELKKLAMAAIEEKWPDKAKRPRNLKTPFRDGDTEYPDRDGYQNSIFVRASSDSKHKPAVVNAKREPIYDEGEVYAGCYGYAIVSCYAFNKAGNAGVAFSLHGFQKVKDGESFASRVKAEDYFADASGEANADLGDNDVLL